MAYDRLPADLPKRLRAAGLKVVVIRGWRRRGRPASTGGFDPVGVLWHHTGSNAGGKSYANWIFKVGRSDLPAPLCQIFIDRDGTVYVGAAGRANHAGRARPSGSVAGGDGNRLYVGVECASTGKSGYPQRAAMVTTGAVLMDVLGTSVRTQRAHKETSYTGKWDPGGLDMDKFRRDIAGRHHAMHAPEPKEPETVDYWHPAGKRPKQTQGDPIERAKADLRESKRRAKKRNPTKARKLGRILQKIRDTLPWWRQKSDADR